MSNTVTIASVVELTVNEMKAIKTNLHLQSDDTVINLIDKNLIAGIKVTLNGKTIDLSVKRQLGEI